MSPEQLTAVGGLVVSLLTLVVVPFYIKRSAAKEKLNRELDATDLKSWQSVTGVLQKERDALQARVNNMETEYDRRINELRTRHDQEMTEAKSRIRHLEEEVADLYRRLYGRPPTP